MGSPRGHQGGEPDRNKFVIPSKGREVGFAPNRPLHRAASEDMMTGWQWPMTREPPMVLPPAKVPPIGPELPPPMDVTMPISVDLPTVPSGDPIEPPL